MIKNFVILLVGLILGLTIPTAISAVNKSQSEDVTERIYTMTVQTNEGNYRLFVYHDWSMYGLAGGITAVKIK